MRKSAESKEPVLPYGGLELGMTDEEILEIIREFPYVMSKLKDC